MTRSQGLRVMFNLKMEPRWNCDIGQVLQTNAKEERKLKLQLGRINTAKREQLGKIDQEMISLRKQLLEDRKIFGTRSDIKRPEDKNGNILEGSCEDIQLHNVQPKLTGLQQHEVINRNCFKPLRERSHRSKSLEQRERKLSPSRLGSTAQEGNGSLRRKMPEVGLLPPSCSTPSLRFGRRHSIAEINLNDTLLSKICPQTNSGGALKNTSLSSTAMTGMKMDHPRLRQRRASLPQAMLLERADHPVDLPKLKTIKLQPERSKLAMEKDSNQNVKLGNFSRHVNGDLKFKRRNSLPNFDNLPSNREPLVCKERLTARMQSRPKPGSANNRNVASPTKPSIFGRQFKKNPTPVSERSDEGDWNEQDDSESLGRVSLVEANEPEENDAEEISSEQELSFIPKATLQEKMNKFFMEWVEGPDEEPRTDIEELLQEFRKEKVQRSNKAGLGTDMEIESAVQEISQCSKDILPDEDST